MLIRLLIALAGFAAIMEGCTVVRKREEGEEPDHIYRTIKPILDKNCTSCHNETRAEGNYDLSTYVRKTPEGLRGVLGKGTDNMPNAIAGSFLSRLLTVLKTASHQGFLTALEEEALTHWVIHDKLAYFWISGMHDSGWLNPASPAFHARTIGANGWDMAECRSCHGEEGEAGGAYAGGKVAVGFDGSDRHVQSCVECHGESPESCATCHSPPDPSVPGKNLRWEGTLGPGAHASHLQGSGIANPVGCDTCHVVPEQFSNASHLDGALPADVTFGGMAKLNGYEPAWDRQTISCATVYCHQSAEPVWTKMDGSQKTCTSCHSEHSHGVAEGTCSVCHGKIADAGKNIKTPALHVNGSVQLGDAGVLKDDATCQTCHDLESEPVKPLNWTGSLGPGMHPLHVSGAGMMGAIACAECHSPVASLHDAGHIDTPLPAEVFFGSKARQNGFHPLWNRESASCSNVYCHQTATPKWAGESSTGTTCTSCHGTHSHGVAEGTCSVCHGKVVDADKNFVTPSMHLDGSVALGPSGAHKDDATCQTCHDMESTPAVPLSWEGSLGAGAHSIHVTGGGVMSPMECKECHPDVTSLHSPGHIDHPLPATIQFSPLSRARTNGFPAYWDDTLVSCAVYCHTSPKGLSSPAWNASAVSSCNSCHDTPPSLPHPQVTGLMTCAYCHSSVVDTSGNILQPSLHMNGSVNF